MPDQIPSWTKAFTRDTSKDIYEEVSYDTTKPKFDVVTIKSDVTGLEWFSTSSLKNQMVFVKKDGLGIDSTVYTSSGTSYPSSHSNGDRCYRTDLNLLYTFRTSNNQWNLEDCLPIAIVQPSSTEAAKTSSIDQVFNGFGYIGSTAFALPGVKGLIPNGRNTDGSLKNIEFTVDKVVTRTITWNNSAGQELFIGKYNLNDGIQFISSGHINTYFQQEDEPTKVLYAMWYKPSENKTYRCIKDSNGNLIWVDNFPCYIGQWFTSATSPYPITELTTKLPFHAVDWNDSSWIAQQAMPSNRYIDLTLGASGSKYTAPANGYVALSASWTNENSYFDIDNLQYIICHNQTGYNGYTKGSGYIPVKRGQIFTVYYQNIELKWFMFIYAEGDK